MTISAARRPSPAVNLGFAVAAAVLTKPHTPPWSRRRVMT